MFGNSSAGKSPDSLLELFKSVSLARSSSSAAVGADSQKSGGEPAAKASDGSFLKHFLAKPVVNGTPAASGSSSDSIQGQENSAEVMVQFKRCLLETRSELANRIESKGSLLAYLVTNRRIRVFDMISGSKCAIDWEESGSTIISLAWCHVGKRSLLAILSSDCELVIKSIVENADEGLLEAESVAMLSFPEIESPKNISWSRSTSASPAADAGHLVVFGKASEIFFVHCGSALKTSFATTSVGDIQDVVILDDSCFVLGANGLESFRFARGEFVSESFSLLKNQNCSVIAILPFSGNPLRVVAASSNQDSLVFFEASPGAVKERSSLKMPGGFLSESLKCRFDCMTQTLAVFSPGSDVGSCQMISLRDAANPHFIDFKAHCLAEILGENIVDLVFDSSASVVDNGQVELSMFVYSSTSIRKLKLEFPAVEPMVTEEASEAEAEVEQSELLEEEEPEAAKTPSSLSRSSPVTVYEAVSSEMLAVIRDTVSKEVRVACAETLQSSLADMLHEAVSKAVEAGLRQIGAELAVLTRQLISNAALETNSSEESAPRQEAKSAMDKITALIEAGKVGQALCEAVEQLDHAQILGVCRRIEDPFSALDGDDFVLPLQGLISLFYALSTQVQDEPEMKLDWLQEVLIQINSEDEEALRSESGPEFMTVVNRLFHDLKALLTEEGGSADNIPLHKQIKTVMRLLRKFQMS